MANAPFPITPELMAIAIAYKNTRLIADEVLPRVPVGKQDFKYWQYDKRDSFTIPDTKVGRRSKPNEVSFGATEATASTSDYGLDDPIPKADIDNSPANYNLEGRSVEMLTDLIMLDREVRTAGLVFNAASYASANKVQLAGANQWSDVDADPIATILAALDACIMRPNVMVIGRAAMSALSRHPRIVKAVLGNSGDSGIARRKDIADLFELDDVLVGEAWLNTAKKGQAALLARAWGKHAALIYRNRQADTRTGVTYGFTAEFGGRIAGSNPDPNIGLRGGKRIRVGESVKELITANDLGYFIQDAAA